MRRNKPLKSHTACEIAAISLTKDILNSITIGCSTTCESPSRLKHAAQIVVTSNIRLKIRGVQAVYERGYLKTACDEADYRSMRTNFITDEPVTSTARQTKNATNFGGVTVIVPCYNEEKIITETVAQIVQTMNATNRPYELIVVDDGSSDGTVEALQNCAHEPAVKVMRNKRNRGYGYSLKRAVNQSKHELIVITDADGTYPNERIGELVDMMDEVDMVVGARIGAKVNIPLIRKPAKWAITQLASYLAETKIPDLNSGLRVMKKSLIQRFMSLLPDGFSFTTTITLSLLTHGYDVRYVPIDYAKRIGKSSIRPIRDTLNFLHLIVRTVMYFKPLKIFVPVSAAIFITAIVVAITSKLILGQIADVTSITLALSSIQILAIGLLADLIDKRSPRFA